MSRDSYDQIAAVYATDMGQSMAFDDVGFYRELCRSRGGRVLELGCGTGRILLPLLESGIDIAGIDQSPGMLAELQRSAAAKGLAADVALGTLTDFTWEAPCSLILAPYSVVTYLTDESALATCFARAGEALAPGGMFALDTFIPRDVKSFDDFRLDYRRPHGAGMLQREKRIAREGHCNRIERRYTLLDAGGQAERSWTTLDVIRPWSEAELRAVAAGAGFACTARVLDFGAASASQPQFVALQFERR